MAVNNSIQVGPLVLLLEMFVMPENIMKRPVLVISNHEYKEGREK